MWHGKAIRWDPAKAKANFRRRGVHFAKAGTVLRDPGVVHGLDLEHGEERVQFVGMSERGRLLFVVLAERERSYWLITARRASRGEIDEYREANP